MKWEKIKVGDLVELKQGYAINKKTNHHLSDEITDLPLLRIADMQNDEYSIYVRDTIPKRFIASKNDIIYTRTGRVGLVFKGKSGVVHNNCFTVNSTDSSVLDQDFLFWALQTEEFSSIANSKATGVAQPDLPHDAFRTIEIPLPPVELQRKIVSILYSYNVLIQNNQKQIKLLEETAQRLYKEWFVDLRFPGHENVKIVNGVPEGWGYKNICDICETVGGGTPSTKVNEYYENGNIRWVTPTDITKNNCLVLLDSEKKITEEGLKHSSAKMVPSNTILMTSRASVGYFGMCEYEVCTNQGFISCIPYDDEMRMYLLYNLIFRTNEIRQKAGGSTYLEITKNVFRSLPILIPEKGLARRFNETISNNIALIRNKAKQIVLLQEARDRLLPKLMSGEIEL